MIKALALAALVGAAAAASFVLENESEGARSVTRTYYVAADVVAWDYAPADRDEITGRPFSDEAKVFVERGPKRIGDTYKKALYREYTDASFTTLKERPPQWRHLGLLGPVLRGAVGDTIRVLFKNNLPFAASMHPHGVLYDKASEGALYNDGTTQKADDAVPPGGTHTYVWEIPERAGPGPMDGSSVMWMYHGHVNEPQDTNSGLMGPIIVTRTDGARPDGSPSDVDREFVTLFSVIDENDSPLLEGNIRTYAGNPAAVKPDDDGFVESNLMHSVNGYVFGNLPLDALAMKQGERVRWYWMGMGTEVDLHTPHWHGNTVTIMEMRTDVVSLLPATMQVADMTPDDPGTWLLHCHVNDHIKAGMAVRYRVLPS
jgi:FtsP/CotA-like multicopper oxidase with cupredoxin domain